MNRTAKLRATAWIAVLAGLMGLTVAIAEPAHAFPEPDTRPLCRDGRAESPVLNLTFRTGTDDLRGSTQDIFSA